tara:strand:+ start:355 stop:1857 length:1503 start_codon:yes stop_codon:yes gene_type:complete
MTITNQTNPIGSIFESDRSVVYISQKDGGLFGKSEKIYTSTRLTKISNTPGPNQYRVEVFQHSNPSGGNTTQIGTVVDGRLVLNSAVEYGNAFSEDSFKLQVEAQIKNQKKNAEKKIKNKVSSDTESIFVSEELTKDTGITAEDVENGLGGGRLDDSRELRLLNTRKDKLGARDNKNTYGVLFYPSFIEKSNQDKLKITILEFAPKKAPKGKVTKTKQVFSGEPGSFGRKDVEYETEGLINPRDKFSFDSRKRMEFSKRTLGHMTLPIPDGVSDANRVNFGNGNLNPAQAIFADVASAAFLGTGDKVSKKLSELVNSEEFETDQIKKSIGALAAGNVLGVNSDEFIARTEGQIFNNNLELLFQGPTLRSFNFQYKFSPRDESEIKQVMKIIRAFKQSSAVQRSKTGIFLITPNTYKLEFKKGGRTLGTSNRHRFLPRMKECALLGVNVNYMPEGSYMTYDTEDISFEGSMVTYVVTLSFQELDPVFNGDYETGDLGGIGF